MNIEIGERQKEAEKKLYSSPLYALSAANAYTHMQTHTSQWVRLLGHPNVKVTLRVQKTSLCF